MKIIALFIASLVFAISSVSANEAVKLLNHMSLAMHNLDYHGRLVYSNDGSFETFDIIHVVENGVEREQVTKIDDQENVIDLNVEGFSFSNFPQIGKKMLEAYSFDIGGEETIAGHHCHNVVARPKDRMRYLHQYCIDKDRGMLLRYALVNSEREIVEKVIFTQIEFSKKPIRQSKTASVNKNFQPYNLKKDKKGAVNSWYFSKLPSGFAEVEVLSNDETLSNDASVGGSLHDDFTQIILTDRVASVSVFIEPKMEERAEDGAVLSAKSLNNSSGSKGAINNLTLEKSGHVLTAVGDVPESTLRAILEGMRYVPK